MKTFKVGAIIRSRFFLYMYNNMLCDNLLEEGERTRIARICTDFLLNLLNLCEGVRVGGGGAIVCIDFFGVGGRECWRRWGFVCIFVVSKLASKTT